jgi:hypothetical protein
MKQLVITYENFFPNRFVIQLIHGQKKSGPAKQNRFSITKTIFIDLRLMIRRLNQILKRNAVYWLKGFD